MASQILGSEKLPGEISVRRGSNLQLTITEKYNYLVETDDITTTRQDVIFNTPGLPIVGLLYAQNGLICSGKDAKRREDNPFYWDVTCDFESGREDQQQSPDAPNSPDPTTWLPVFVVDSFETKEKVITKDKSKPNAKLIVNAAGQRFETPQTELVTLASFSFAQFEPSSLTLSEIMERNHTINKDPISGTVAGNFAERTLKLNVIKAELGYFAGVFCWRIQYKVTYDRDTWDTELLNVGPMYRKTAGSDELVAYTQGAYQIVGNLAADGTKRAMNLDPLTIKFKTIDEISFSFIRT